MNLKPLKALIAKFFVGIIFSFCVCNLTLAQSNSTFATTYVLVDANPPYYKSPQELCAAWVAKIRSYLGPYTFEKPCPSASDLLPYDPQIGQSKPYVTKIKFVNYPESFSSFSSAAVCRVGIGDPVPQQGSPVYLGNGVCDCAMGGRVYNASKDSCDVVADELVIVGSSETKPTGTNAAADLPLIARVTRAGVGRAGVSVNFSIDVTKYSGGHEHDDASRPRGILVQSGLQISSGVTDSNGEFQFSFRPPEIAGVYQIYAGCEFCVGYVTMKEIQVKVPNLVPISPNPPQNVDGSYAYALTSVDAIHQGNGRYHHNQYYLAEQARKNLSGLIVTFGAEGWGTVALNDASMFWGGRYDISGNWTAPHAGHRDGREIDISFKRAGNPISTAKQNDFYDKFCKAKASEASFSILHHFVLLPHFHVYLEKQQACGRTER